MELHTGNWWGGTADPLRLLAGHDLVTSLQPLITVDTVIIPTADSVAISVKGRIHFKPVRRRNVLAEIHGSAPIALSAIEARRIALESRHEHFDSPDSTCVTPRDLRDIPRIPRITALAFPEPPTCDVGLLGFLLRAVESCGQN